jgi:hypothetical protein
LAVRVVHKRNVIKWNIGIVYDLPARIEVPSKRTVGIPCLYHVNRGAIAAEHDHAVLLVGDPSIHPRLELIGDDLTAFQAIPNNAETTGPAVV